MAVNVRQRKTRSGKMFWQADIRLMLPDGTQHRERPRAPGKTRAQALRWARQREVHIIRSGLQGREDKREQDSKEVQIKNREPEKVVPTLREFSARFMNDYVAANRFSPCTKRNYEVALTHHLLPVLGELRLDAIGPEHVQALKRRRLAPTTTNNYIAKLRSMLRRAKEWGLIEEVLEVRKLRVGERQPVFFDFDEYARLVSAATTISKSTLALVLLGGDAGLRIGELRGLRWRNVHLDREAIFVCENLVASDPPRLPKGQKTRWVPITEPLKHALAQLERRGQHVLCNKSARHLGTRTIADRLAVAQRRAGLEVKGPHVLRHTFCSHLAMRGTPQKVIQELAGHAHSSTTEVYMHLAPHATRDAIKNLRTGFWHHTGTSQPDEA